MSKAVRAARWAGVGVVFALGIAACDDAHEEEHEGQATGALCPSDNTLSYDTFGKAFMADYCVDCHSSEVKGSARRGAPAGTDFDTLAAIRLHSGHIDAHAAAGPKAVNDEMPEEDPRPTLEQRIQLGQWLACGAP